MDNNILHAWFSKKMYFAMPPMGLANFGLLYKLVDSDEEVLTTCVSEIEIQPSDYLFDDMKYLGKVVKNSARQLLPC